MEQVFEGVSGVEVIIYGILVYGKTGDEHDENLRAALQRAQDSKLRLNRKKCIIKQKEVKYVCWTHISEEGLKAEPGKVRVIVEMPRPTDKAGVQRLLGMLNYVGKFVPNMSDLTPPLRVLQHKETEWHWFERQERSFVAIKETLIAAPVLAFYDPKQELTLQVDASSTGVGAALIQGDRPAAYASKALTPLRRIIRKSRRSC